MEKKNLVYEQQFRYWLFLFQGLYLKGVFPCTFVFTFDFYRVQTPGLQKSEKGT